MAGWNMQGSNLRSTMPMREARSFKMANGKYEGSSFGLIARIDPGYILWLRTNGYGKAKEAAIVLGPFAEAVAAELTEIATNSLRNFKLDEMPF